jgi:serine/threonine protein kinase
MQSVLVGLLRQVRSDIQVNPQADGPIARLLPPGDREWLIKEHLTLLCPLIDSADRLLGLVAIGESRGGLPYTKQDRMFITAISRQAAVQLENRWLQEVTGEKRGRPQPHGTVAIDWDNEAGAQCPNCSMIWPGHVRQCSCHTPTVPAAVPVVVNGKFKVERLLGAGGMGVVYLAVDVTLDRKVAVKTLPKVTPDRVISLQREARTMASVRHPNLALIYGAEHWRGTPMLIVEYLEGGTLSEYLRRGALAVVEAIDLGIVLADVLARVHASGILHRDIKPSNIAYTSDGVAKLLDFGVAAMVDLSIGDDGRPPGGASKSVADLIAHAHPLQTLRSSTLRLVGTPLYLSPEAMAGHVPHPSFDLWSVSLVLYEALTGHHPFDADTVTEVMSKIQLTEVPDVRDFRPDCPASVAALLRDCLSPVPTRRPPSATELRVRLQRLRASLDPAIA